MFVRVHRVFGAPVSAMLVGSLVLLTVLGGAGDALAQPRFADEEFYRGILLAQGPVAAQIPEIRDTFRFKDMDPKAARLVNDFHARLIDTIHEQDPAFLARFARTMQSGDHFAIDAMLTEGTKATISAIRVMPEILALRDNIAQDPAYVSRLVQSIREKGDKNVNETAVRQAINLLAVQSLDEDPTLDPEPDGSIIAVLVAVTYVAVVHALAAVFSLAAAVAISVWVAGPETLMSLPGGTLLREQIVHSIATRFASRS